MQLGMCLGDRRQCRIIHGPAHTRWPVNPGVHSGQCRQITEQTWAHKNPRNFTSHFHSAGSWDSRLLSPHLVVMADGFADAATVLPETDFQFDAPRFYDLCATDEGHDEYA